MTEFAELILKWYERYARVLPWRGSADPYAVWVSEIMLQQTRVESVIPYFERWMLLFPTIDDLALAPLQSVLSAWEGLGYYSRVRNLHKAAMIVKNEYGGNLPQELAELRKLPGIGRYTAAAILSIAFNQDVASLDGNLRRVFARVFDVALQADSPAGEKALWKLAQDNLPVGSAGAYNQALMDLGAGICLPKKPMCLLCPVKDLCRSIHAPESRPILKARTVPPHKYKMAAVVVQASRVLITQRSTKGLLGGMWEFPAVEVKSLSPDAMPELIKTYYQLEVKPIGVFKQVEHAYTHFTLTEEAWLCDFTGDLAKGLVEWISLAQLENYPMGKVDRVIARSITKFYYEQEQRKLASGSIIK